MSPGRYPANPGVSCILTSCCRSEDIDLFKLNIHKDSDWHIMNELGKIGSLHFIDLNKELQPYELKFTNNIKKTEEALRKIE